MGVHPSMVTHWKTVSMARTMLSKLVIPWLGPSQFSRHTDSLALARRTVKQKYKKKQENVSTPLPLLYCYVDVY